MMKDYVKSYAPLQRRLNCRQKLYPNIVAVVYSVEGDNWEHVDDFTRAMKGLTELDIIDYRKPNIIGILTHALRVGASARDKARWTQSINLKKNSFQNALKSKLGMTVPICVIENNFINESIDGRLEQENGRMGII